MAAPRLHRSPLLHRSPRTQSPEPPLTVVTPSRARLVPLPARGMDLDAFLLRHRPTLRFTRIFYVVRPHLEGRNWCKIGVASGSSPEAAYSRLRAYTVLYGCIRQAVVCDKHRNHKK